MAHGEQDLPSARPTTLLPWRQLGLMSVYWFGINLVWGAYEGFGQKQIELLVGRGSVGTTMGSLELVGGIIALLTVPMVGSLSDFTISRFGKRKGYIITGSIFDLLFIAGLSLIAMAQPADWDGSALGTPALLAVYALCYLGLQFSSNVAQGPYQGLVPDLVAERQVGVASGLVGVMRIVGLIGGIAVMAIVGVRYEQWGLALLSVGIVELVLAVLTFLYVDDGPQGRPREGRSWTSIALRTWDPGILRERSFIRMTLVRLFFLMGAGTFINISLLYIERVFDITDGDEKSVLWMAALGLGLVGTVLSAVPAGRISDRIGRKPVVWAAAVAAATGVLVLALAPNPAIALTGSLFLGVGYGAYVAVDWALMTDIIPLASAGRYMGIANIANSLSGPLGLAIAGPVMDVFLRAGDAAMGARLATGLGIIALALASVLLLGVHPRREPVGSDTDQAPTRP